MNYVLRNLSYIKFTSMTLYFYTFAVFSFISVDVLYSVNSTCVADYVYSKRVC